MIRLLSSFRFAFTGIIRGFIMEKNLRIQVCMGFLMIFFAIYFHVSNTEWAILIICCGLVLCLEMINTAIEKLCDVVQLDIHPGIKKVKDIAAGAVMMAAIGSLAIGLIIFLPKIIVIIKSF